jgi:WD40 repeat protein
MLILTGHKRMVNSVCFSPDGDKLLSTGGFSTDEARLFDLESRKARWVRDEGFGAHRFFGAVFTPEGSHLLTCDHLAGCRLLDADTLAETPLPLGDAVARPFSTPIFSPDGTRLLARAELWETAPHLHWWAYPSWEPLPTWTVQIQWGFRHCNPLFSPDSRTLADVAGFEVILYDVATGQERRRLPLELKQGMATMAWAPNARLLASASGPALTVWDTATGAEVAALRQKKKYFLGLAFTPDGGFLGTVSNEETVKMWDTSSWNLAREYAWEIGGLKCLAFSRNGHLGAAGSEKKRIVVWDLDD